MEKPEGCPNRLYQLMNTCWQYSPRQRPTFLDIIDELLQDIPLTAAAFAQVDRRILIEMLPPSFIENWTLTTRLPFVLLLFFFCFRHGRCRSSTRTRVAARARPTATRRRGCTTTRPRPSPSIRTRPSTAR